MDSENNMQSFLNQNQEDLITKNNQEEKNIIAQENTNMNGNNLPQLLQNIEIDAVKNQQRDFIKKLKYFTEVETLISISEHNSLNFYKIIENKSESLNASINFSSYFEKNFGMTPIYDFDMLSESNMEVDYKLLLSRKDHPVTIYSINENKEFKDLASIKICKRNSEKFLSPLAMKIQNDSLIAGGNSFLFIFDINSFKEKILSKIFKKQNIISCLDIPNENSQNFEFVKDIVALGKFDKKLLLYSQTNDQILFEMKAHVGGITDLKFMPSNNLYIFSGARKDNLIYMWDLRKTDEFLTFFERKCNTNQRMFFDLNSNGTQIYLGNQDGTLISYNLDGNFNFYFPAHDDCLNSVISLHFENKEYLATSSGQRDFQIFPYEFESVSESSCEEESDFSEKKQNNPQNSLKIWSI